MSSKGTLTIRVIGDDKSFRGMTDSVARSVGGLGKTVGKAALGLAAGVGAVAGGLGLLATKTAEYGDEIAKGARATGLSVEGYQELRYALGQSGLGADQMHTAMSKLNLRVGDAAGGNAEYQATLDRLGVSIRDATGEMRSQDEIFTDVMRGLEGLQSSQERAAAASDLFGAKVGPELASAIESGVGGIDELRQRARDLGIVMTDEAAAGSEAFGDALDDLKLAGGGLARSIGAELMPILTDGMLWAAGKFAEASAWMGTKMDALRDWWAEHGPAIKERIREVGQAVLDWWQNTAAPAIGEVRDRLASFWNDTAKPILAELKQAWIDNKDTLAAVAGNIGSILRDLGGIISEIFTAAETEVQGSTESMGEDLTSLVESLEIITGAVAGLIGWIRDLAELGNSGPFSVFADATRPLWDVVGAIENIIKKWNELKVALGFAPDLVMPTAKNRVTRGFMPDVALAAGGIVTRPTIALIGEAGPEAVVPLDRLGGMSSETHLHLHGLQPSPQEIVRLAVSELAWMAASA